MYQSRELNLKISLATLLNKVQWDIRFYFTYRGSENVYGMKKSQFRLVCDDEKDICYIELAEDEETKNHKETDIDIDSHFMSKMKDSKCCPVTSYLTYFMSLN